MPAVPQFSRFPRPAPPVLQARGIGRSFPGVRALDGVDLMLRAGEINALMGQNGAGKSTLIKVLTGVCAPDVGTIELDGVAIRPGSPLAALRLGISTVYQEVNLCPNLSVAENIFAGRYPRRPWRRGGGIDWSALNERARTLLGELNLGLDVTRLLASYPVAIQQMVAIARAVSTAARVLILDEPTSSLDEDEVERLFALLDRLRRQGLAILFVTHFLDQVYAIADRITVLRNGRLVGEYRVQDLGHGALVAAMVGREVAIVTGASPAGAEPRPSTVPVLAARGIARRGSLHPVDIELRRGEIVGLAGLLGSGRTELARLLFGLDRADAGHTLLDGKPHELAAPSAAVACGMAFCPEERKTEGVVADLSVRDNIVLALQARLGLWRRLTDKQQRAIAERFVKTLDIRTASVEAPLGQLSGGNQQKVLLARWLATEPRVLILDEPTRGVDVAARQEIMNLVVALARDGLAVLFISAEIEEVIRVSDRILVMRDRRPAGELPAGCDEHAVYALIAQPESA
jgi:simple sugar transport system ATP-binding protein